MSSLRNRKPHSLRIPELRLDILKAFGADLNTSTRENLVFVNKVLCYPVGHHIALRDIYNSSGDNHKNDIMFIYLENEVLEINSLNVSNDNYLLLVTTEFPTKAEINIYNLFKITFAVVSSFQPKRKIISSTIKRFIHAAFSTDGNCIACIGETKEGKLQGLIYDVQSFQKYKKDNYTPKNIFDLSKGVNKISYNNKTLCTSGKNHLAFWFLFEHTCKEYKCVIDCNKNYVDHAWVDNEQVPTVITVTEDNDIIVFHAVYEVNKITKKVRDDLKIEKFVIKQLITNAFKFNDEGQLIVHFNNNNNNHNDNISNEVSHHTEVITQTEMEDNINHNKKQTTLNKLVCTSIYSLPYGIVIGTNRGNLLFLEKGKHNDYIPIRFTLREKEAKVTCITASCLSYDYLAISFDSNEIAYIPLVNLFSNLKNEKFEINFNVICEGFHCGPITTMDVAQQRPIIITTSTKDKTVRVWNYLTGHCEYCKIILEEKEDCDEKEMDILAVAIHPNGYYIAISDVEMIRFFHLCYKELRFYNNDQITNEPNKSNCTILKFSNGGHLLAAVSERHIFIIRSYSRETLKTIHSQHKDNIIALYFHSNDNYLYSVGEDGLIVQYDLFDFSCVVLSNKVINYTSSGMCSNYNLTHKEQQHNLMYTSTTKHNDDSIPLLEDKIISCGYESSSFNKHVISTLSFTNHKTEETHQPQLTLSPIECNSTAICNINSKRFGINSIAIGNDNGELCLYSHYINEVDGVVKFDSVMAHKTKINSIHFSRDTNLLFSAGEDGNIFIYTIYETPDGENIQFEDNKNVAITQLHSILDEGLGDNVLVSLYELAIINETLDKYKAQIYNLEKQSDEVTKSCDKMMREKEMEINRKKENEINDLRSSISDLTHQHDALIQHYQTEIDSITNENKQKALEREMYLNNKKNELRAQIEEIQQQNAYLKEDFEKIMTNNETDHLKKFREFEYALKKRFMNISTKNEQLSVELDEQQQAVQRKIKIMETDHELEIVDQNDKYQKILSKNEKEIHDRINEINKLKETKSQLEKTIISNENNLKKLKEDHDRLIGTINTMRNQLEVKENEKESLNKKLHELEQALQEKSKLEGFANELKNELYKKNVNLNDKFNEEITTKEELKDSTQVLEKQLEETILLLINREKDMNKQKILIDELKRKWDEQKHETNVIQKDYDNLLKKIYNTFQSNDKKLIVNGITEIYHRYLSHDAEKNYDSNKLNVNIQNELEKQIDFLQGQLGHVSGNKNKNEKIQVFQYQRKMQENTMLIEEMTRLKKIHSEFVNEIKELKTRNVALSSELENTKRQIHAIKFNKTNVSNNYINNNLYNDTSSQTSFNAKICTSLNNTSISSISQSEFPMITNVLTTMDNIYSNDKTKAEMRTMKQIKNKVFIPGQVLELPTERAFKYKEMKRIIEGKNDIIQRLSVENDLLKKLHFTNYNGNKRSSSPLFVNKDNKK